MLLEVILYEILFFLIKKFFPSNAFIAEIVKKSLIQPIYYIHRSKDKSIYSVMWLLHKPHTEN